MTVPRRPDDSLRDPVLDAAWNAHSTELPPARVDAAILAAAHREAKARPQAVGDDDGSTHARRPARAWWGFAAAATIGAIAFGVVQLAPPTVQKSDPMVASDIPPSTSPSPRSEGTATPMAEAPAAPSTPDPSGGRAAMSRADEAPASVPHAPPPRAEAETIRKAAKVARADRGAAVGDAPMQPEAATSASAREQGQQRAEDARTAQDKSASTLQPSRPPGEPRVAAMAPPPPAAPIPPPRPFPATPPPIVAESGPTPGAAQAPADAAKAESSNAFTGRRMVPPDRAAAMAAPQAGAAAAPQRQRDADSQPLAKLRALTPEAWIERIRMLHAQQRLDEAARELNAFRDAFPDADRQLPSSLAAWAAGVKRNPP